MPVVEFVRYLAYVAHKKQMDDPMQEADSTVSALNKDLALTVELGVYKGAGKACSLLSEAHKITAEVSHVINNVGDGLSGLGVSNSIHSSAEFLSSSVASSLSTASSGVSLGLNVIQLGYAINEAIVAFGRRAAGDALLALISSVYNEENMYPSSFFENLTHTTADLKEKFALVKLGSPMLNNAVWVVYKYKPTICQEIKDHLSRFGPAIIGICASILSILAIASSVATLGAAPAVVAAVSAVIGLGMVVKKAVKNSQSGDALDRLIASGDVTQSEYAQITKYASFFHKYGGRVSVGDMFRYRIAKAFVQSAHFRQTYVNAEYIASLTGDVVAVSSSSSSSMSEFDDDFNFSPVTRPRSNAIAPLEAPSINRRRANAIAPSLEEVAQIRADLAIRISDEFNIAAMQELGARGRRGAIAPSAEDVAAIRAQVSPGGHRRRGAHVFSASETAKLGAMSRAIDESNKIANGEITHGAILDAIWSAVVAGTSNKIKCQIALKSLLNNSLSLDLADSSPDEDVKDPRIQLFFSLLKKNK